MIKKVYSHKTGFYYDVFAHSDGTMYLVALCAGIAWSHVGIILSDDEITQFNADHAAFEAIAHKMCFDFTPFRSRAIPPDVQAILLKL